METKNKKTGRDLVPGFAGLITQTRTALGWTYQELADAADISRSSVQAIEREERAPSLRVALALTEAMGLRGWLERLE